MFRTTAGQVEVAEVWEEVLKVGGLIDIVAGSYKRDVKAEASGNLKLMGLKSVLAAFPRMFTLFTKNQDKSKVLKNAVLQPKSAVEYAGYGVYAGRKVG